MDISYIINELGEDRENYFNAVSPPIFQTANFSFKSVADMRHVFEDEYSRAFYTRGNNPTVDLLNKKMAALEKTEAALSFSSGSAAIAAAVMANLSTGDHIVCVEEPYSWTNKLLNMLLPRFGVTATMVDGTDSENYRKAIQPNTKLLYLESPNSFTFELQDIEAVVKIAKEHNILTMMDNSYASPLNMNPVDWGVDIIAHAATKYIGGHSDALGGIICGTEAMMRKIFHSEFMTIGGTISPFNAWLLLRGLRTLPLRMQQVADNTLQIAEYLENHPKIAKVHYPFLPSHPQYTLAKKQMKRGAAQLSIQLKTQNVAEVEKFCDALSRILLGASWGSYESLAFPSCVAFEEPLREDGYPLNFIRLSIGLESADLLITDLAQALEKI